MTQKTFLKLHNKIRVDNADFDHPLLNSLRFNVFKYFLKLCIIVLILPGINVLNAQETYNLEVIFKKTHEPTTWFEGFGQALSTAGDVNSDGFDDILIGSPSGEVRGRCYLYLGRNPMDTLVDMVFYGDTAGDGFAISISSGYLNDDSFPDIVIGLPNGWVNGTQPGKVYVYFGGSGLDTIPDIILVGENNTEAFGYSVACGDMNGDGSDDLVIGANCYPNSFICDGRVYVYYGGPLLDTIPDVIINGHDEEAFGTSVGSGGDVNSDGFEDIVVGADENSEAYPGAGKVYVFFGGNPMDTIPDCWLHGEGVTHYLGWFNVDIVTNLGFYDRILTGTKLWPNGFMSVNSGKIYILDGGSPPDTIADVWMVGRGDSSFLGNWTASVNKVNFDDYGEVLSGAPGDPPDDYGLGIGYLWVGSETMDTIPDAWLKGRYYGDAIGRRVASAGDVNGDGFDEVMFSNYTADSNQTVWLCRYTGTAITEVRSKKRKFGIEVYPNPFTKILSIEFLAVSQKTKIKIYDVIGREVMFNEIKKQAKSIRINTQNLPCGVYFVEIEADGKTVIRKAGKIR